MGARVYMASEYIGLPVTVLRHRLEGLWSTLAGKDVEWYTLVVVKWSTAFKCYKNTHGQLIKE